MLNVVRELMCICGFTTWSWNVMANHYKNGCKKRGCL